MRRKRNLYLDGIMGVVVGDALGVPAEFSYRDELKEDPVVGMRGYGTYDLPAGSWSDDSSMTLATWDSLKNKYDLEDMMNKFVEWMEKGAYTPFGEMFDIGNATSMAILRYKRSKDVRTCGGRSVRDNGNGSLMRIMPICLQCYDDYRNKKISKAIAIERVCEVSSLTHAHMRSNCACALYYFMVKAILEGEGSLLEKLQIGLEEGFDFFSDEPEAMHYSRLINLHEFKTTAEENIQSTGYVVDTLEAVVWCLINTDTYKEAMLKAVNLGSDTDTVAAIAGGLAGLHYGYDAIPKEWLHEIQRRDWIEGLLTNEKEI